MKLYLSTGIWCFDHDFSGAKLLRMTLAEKLRLARQVLWGIVRNVILIKPAQHLRPP